MNNISGNTVSRSTQNSQISTQSDYSSAMQTFENAFLFFAFISIAILILWIWSMFSMIMLNARFKEFNEMYIRDRDDNRPNNVSEPNNAQVNLVDTPREEAIEKQEGSWFDRSSNLLKSLVLLVLIAFLGLLIVSSL